MCSSSVSTLPLGVRPHPGRCLVFVQFSRMSPLTALFGGLACFSKHTLVSGSLANVVLHLQQEASTQNLVGRASAAGYREEATLDKPCDPGVSP